MNEYKIYTEGNAYEVIQKDIESGFHKFIGKQPKEIKNIVIVGAYHGYEIDRLLINYPKARFYAFEAYSPHFIVLQKKFINESRVTSVNSAICDYNGVVTFNELSMAGSGSILEWQGDKFGHSAKVVDTIEVQCTRLMDFLSHHNVIEVDLLWADVQGAELKVLKGVDLDRCHSLFLEVHTHDYIQPWNEEPYIGQCYLEDLREFLDEKYKLVSIGLDNDNHNGQGNSFWIRR